MPQEIGYATPLKLQNARNYSGFVPTLKLLKQFQQILKHLRLRLLTQLKKCNFMFDTYQENQSNGEAFQLNLKSVEGRKLNLLQQILRKSEQLVNYHSALLQ